MQTGENDQALRKILDMTRLISVVVLLLHFYKECYGAFVSWHLVSGITDRLLDNVVKTGLFNSFLKPKLVALVFLAIALMGVKAKKDEKQTVKTALVYLLAGLVFFLVSYFILLVKGKIEPVACGYVGVTGLGYLLMMSGGTMLSRIMSLPPLRLCQHHTARGWYPVPRNCPSPRGGGAALLPIPVPGPEHSVCQAGRRSALAPARRSS